MTDQQEMAVQRQDAEWTDAAPSPTEQDYRELQAQHDQLQSQLKAARDEARKYKLAGLGMAASMGEHVCVPEGWQLVPVEVTLPMQHAYFGVIDKNMERVNTDCRFGRYDSSKEAYRAMLAASPKLEAKP